MIENALPGPRPEYAGETEALVRLAGVDGLGPVTVGRLLRVFGSAKNILSAPGAALRRVPGVRSGIGASIARARNTDVRPALRRAAAVRARPIPLAHPAYPDLLRHIHAPPTLLWARGAPIPPDAMCIAIVGSRKASAYGRQVAFEVARTVASQGVVVVSGLAFGIDAEAHRGALEAGGITVAVLGSGVDRITPVSNRPLAARILGSGAVISECLPGTPAAPGHFPRRNRIIAGMSTAVVVVEAAARSGALITARDALEEGREVWAVPGPVTSRTSAGTNQLLADGAARLLCRPSDLLPESSRADASSRSPRLAGRDASAKSLTEREPFDGHSRQNAQVPNDPVERAVGREATPIDVVCARAQLPTAEVLARLTQLEMEGKIRSVDLNHYIRGIE